MVLTAGDTAVDVHADAGGRIGQISVAGQPLLVDVPESADRDLTGWGLFPMAPWVGRIREGRFGFDGKDHQLVVNHHDGDPDDVHRGHSIHGAVFDRDWQIVEHSATSAHLACTLAGAHDWPFDGAVHQHIGLRPGRIDLQLVVTADGGRFPAEIGWHPWFRKPDDIDFTPSEMYARDAFGIPSGALIDPTDGPWDDCFVNVAPVELHYDRAVADTLVIRSDCTHLVVYDHQADATCVEPQSGPPNAFNLIHHVVGPGAPLRRSMSIAW